MAPSLSLSLYSAEIDQRAQNPEAVATAAAAVHAYINVFWPAEGVSPLHLTTAVGFLELLSSGEPLLGASLDDFAVIRTAIAVGVLEDKFSLADRRVVNDILAQAMVHLRQAGAV